MQNPNTGANMQYVPTSTYMTTYKHKHTTSCSIHHMKNKNAKAKQSKAKQRKVK